MSKYKTTNDLVAAIAVRTRALANMKMHQLRLTNGYGCSTEGEAVDKDKHKDRGTIIEEVLLEEFQDEFPIDLESDDNAS